MKEIYVVLGFFLLVGLQILRMIEEQRREAQRTELEAPSTAHSVEGRTASNEALELHFSTGSSCPTLQRTT